MRHRHRQLTRMGDCKSSAYLGCSFDSRKCRQQRSSSFIALRVIFVRSSSIKATFIVLCHSTQKYSFFWSIFRKSIHVLNLSAHTHNSSANETVWGHELSLRVPSNVTSIPMMSTYILFNDSIWSARNYDYCILYFSEHGLETRNGKIKKREPSSTRQTVKIHRRLKAYPTTHAGFCVRCR